MRVAVAFLASAIVACAASPDADVEIGDRSTVSTLVVTERGPVSGIADGDLVEFRGIPYAAPPTGANRFAPPIAAPAWTTPLDATQFGPACPQAASKQVPVQREDCLTLNIWAHATGPRRPVIVWIHGGGYVSGSASSAQYDAAALARVANVDVVSFDYRLGILGFLALPQLAAGDGGIGNWGLRDQIAALEWVKHNAATFGGDASRVMIAGESAGGVSVCTLLAAPAAQHLYAAAAMQSGSCRPILNLTTMNGTFPAAEGEGVAAAIALGCTTGDIAACLRAAPAATVVAAQGKLPEFRDLGFLLGATLPVVDGVVLDVRPFAAIAAGRGAVPLILGSNLDDESAFVASMGVTNATGAFGRYLGQIPTNGHLADLLEAYPAATLGELGAATEFDTDLAFACPTWQVAAIHAAPTYLYELDQGVPNGIDQPLGAVHGLDYVYLFGSFATWDITPAASDLALSATMQHAWGALAYGEPPWPATPAFVGLAPAPTVQSVWRGGRCPALQLDGLLLE